MAKEMLGQTMAIITGNELKVFSSPALPVTASSDMSVHGKTAIGPTARITLRFHAAVANKKINGHVA
jgi:hypothetical protein